MFSKEQHRTTKVSQKKHIPYFIFVKGRDPKKETDGEISLAQK